MALRKIFFVVCLVISMLCLTAGYWIAGQWIGAVIAITASLGWLLARKHPASSLPYICLIASVTLAVAGQMTGGPSLLMICGSGFALAVWDLILLDGALGANSSGEQLRRYENSHLRSLALALGAGLLVVFLGGMLNLQIPFIAMMLLVALILFGFYRVLRTIKKRSTR
jgi:hypothetical protein